MQYFYQFQFPYPYPHPIHPLFSPHFFSIASVCLTLAASFLIHAHYFRSAEPIWWFGKQFNGKGHQETPPIVDDVWQMIAELRGRNAMAKRRRMDEEEKGNDQQMRPTTGNSSAENGAKQYAV